jgi:P2 family phage contractile tail tube protein
MEVTSLIGGMVYGPGGALFGKFDEITVPEVKIKTQEQKATDMIGTRRLPGLSLDPLEATFKAQGFNTDFHALTANPFSEVGLQVRSNQLTARGQGRAACAAVKLELKGWFSSAKEGALKQGEGAQCEYKMEVHAMKLTVDGRDVKEIDVDNYIWKVDGKDLLADFRKNLGIA